MSETVPAFPLQWPIGWKRTPANERTPAKFYSTAKRQYGETPYRQKGDLSIAAARERVIGELRRMGMADHDVVISSNLPLRLDGLPRGDVANPADPSVAVYWRKGNATRCMAIDRYDRVADNLAAIAATLEAMRAIERHGGATILDRAFTGFTALPAPEQWFQVLGVSVAATRAQIELAFKQLAMRHHPDRPGGSAERMARISAARDDGIAQARA